MKRSRKWLAVLLSVLLALGLLPTAVLAEEDPTPEAFPNPFTGLSQGETKWYYLTEDVTQDITVDGATLVLFLEGYTLTGSVTVNSGKLDLRGYHGNETAKDNTGKVTGCVSVYGGEFVLNSGGLGGGAVVNSGTFSMNGGKITGYTTADANGVCSGVTVNGGSFTMTGGEINGSSGNSVSGVIVNRSGSFTMSDGTITGCTVPESANESYKYGAGVTVNGGTFTMNGGGIISNTGGNAGVNVFDGGTFTMNSGTIDGNNGMGLTVSTNNAHAVLSGATTYITHNTGFGALVIDGGILTMNGGTIGPNEDTGVYVAAGGVFHMTDGIIQNNEHHGVEVRAADSDGHSAARFTMSGGDIRGNISRPTDGLAYGGGGVYIWEQGENGETGGVFEVSGSPQIAGNHRADNTDFSDNVRGMIRVAGQLTPGAAIFLNCGFRLEGERTETVVLGGGPYGELGCFISDDENCVIVKSEDGRDLVLKLGNSGAEEPDPYADIDRAQLAAKIQQHASFGLSGKTSNSASVFSDVGHRSDAEQNAIGVLYDEKIMGGTGNGKFNPDAKDVTRAQAAVIIWRTAGSRSNILPAGIPYADIPGGMWYTAAINCLYAMGVLDNTDRDERGNFNPDAYVTIGTVDKWLAVYDTVLSSGQVSSSTVSGGAARGEFLVQYYNYFKNVFSESKRDRNKQPPFEDIYSCTEEEKEAITFWYQVDVIQGTSATTFEPYSAASNVQIAAFIDRIDEVLNASAGRVSTWNLLSQGDKPNEDEYYGSLLASLVERGILSTDAGETIGSNLYAPALTVNMKDWGANTGLATAAPAFSPASGTVFSDSLSVTVKTDTKDAKIYYTTDGSAPTERSTLYEGPFILWSGAVIKAIAVNANGVVSDVAAATYTQRLPAPPVDSGSTGGSGSYNPGGSGGSSGSGSTSGSTTPAPAPAVTTTTTTNSDGSTTTTATDKTTGTVTETTTYPDGAVKVVETTGNGTVTTRETAVSGVQVTTVRAPGAAVTASVTIPAGVDAVTVTIAAAVTPGTVAVDTRTGQVIRLSIPTADGLAVKLDHSADFVLTDRSKSFSDTASHWAEDSITFVAAHELFQGTSASEPTFDPELPMTRVMLMTVLARLDSTENDGGSIGYEQGMAWAVANGISDGSDPDGQITREQLATMLWRYAGFPASSYALNQPDTDSISDYAQTAMAWAVEAGILSGYDDGSLQPDTTATRAVVAAMIQRFCTTLV